MHLHLLNPTHKLRLLSRWLFQRSKRSFTIAESRETFPVLREEMKHHSPVQAKRYTPSAIGELVRDRRYYEESDDGGFCVFQAENTLFKVHKRSLTREPSAFSDMFIFSNPSIDERNEDTPVPLSDGAEQFRDLLWVLHALPNDLCPGLENYTEPSLERLLNIAELTNKYCFASYESWAMERLYVLAQEPFGFLSHSPPDLCARVLNIAVLCDHKRLLNIITQKLITRLLWHNIQAEPIIEIARMHGLRKLLGIAYYRQLIDMEVVLYYGRAVTQPVFSPSVDIEKRTRFLSAHQSLVKTWDELRNNPPAFQHESCNMKNDCAMIWQNMWLDTQGLTDLTLKHGSADVLGKLRAMMNHVRKAMVETPLLSVQCMLSAFEAISATRDEFIDGMAGHFQS